MTNRQDRRYAAKLARQAAKRGRTPAERALFGAAAGFSAGRPTEIDFALPGFDEAWARLEPELRDLLDPDYDAFRLEVFAQATWGGMIATSPSGEEHAFDLEPNLFPVTGRRGDLLAFVAEPANLEALAASLLSSGVVGEETALAILPVVLAAEAVDLRRVGPAAAARLTTSLADLFEAGAPGEAGALALAEAAVRGAGLPVIAAGDEGEGGGGGGGEPSAFLLLAVRLAPPEAEDLSDEDAEARRLVRAATRASWLDTYAADLPFRLGEPVLWHEAGASLAWHAALGEIEEALARRGAREPVTRIDACFPPESGDAVLVALSGGSILGPFRAAGALVAADIDGFAGLAEHYAGELVEHESVADVLRLLGSSEAAEGRD